MNENITLTIDTGTIILVAEILKAERGAKQVDVPDAQKAIVDALRSFSAAGVELFEGDAADDPATTFDPRPPVRCLRWHTCTADDPWTADVSRRASHPDAKEIDDKTMLCPHCDVSFPKT
ncbi:hypothetical protein [Pseudooceanicola spongiae]|uniref:Uncharacterized protein n=1 Tax=Pseudooceanicola spongiae TaxID=2613965 RepID=A0A7L9WMZ2_9RHOB|nr:hypothetical protein [Pseudooceanicola spongiae]QOL80430.1 hypothetical protein F3W81_06150 [Pseudooceanicola spongiae]